METILQDTSATQHLVKGFLDLNKYYNNIFNGIDYDIEEVSTVSEKTAMSTFLQHMTTEIKKNKTIDKNEYIVTAAPCCSLFEEYEKIKGIDYLIPQNWYDSYQNNSCNTMIKNNARRLQMNCLTALSRVVPGSWADDFWTNTYNKLVEKYGKQVRLN